MGIALSGFDNFQRELEELKHALESLNGTVGKLNFTAEPASVQAAIRQMEKAIDQKVAPYGHNPMVSEVAEGAKEHYRDEIRKLAKSKK